MNVDQVIFQVDNENGQGTIEMTVKNRSLIFDSGELLEEIVEKGTAFSYTLEEPLHEEDE